MKGDPFRMCVTSQLGEKGATVTQMHQKLIRGGKKEKEEKEEEKKPARFLLSTACHNLSEDET